VLRPKNPITSFAPEPKSYLRGQVFNNEEESRLPILSIRTFEFVPGGNQIWVYIEPASPLRQDLTILFGATFTAVGGFIGRAYDDLSIDPLLPPNNPSVGFLGLLTSEMTAEILFPSERRYFAESLFNVAGGAGDATYFLRPSRFYRIGIGSATVFVSGNPGGGDIE
jgi:hypothetical protein